jgi:uncharacterized cupin superfamily protein
MTDDRGEMTVSASLGFTPEQILSMDLPIQRPRRDPTEGEPVESIRRLFQEQGTIVGIWESTPGRYPASKRGCHSFMYILSGRATLIDSDGASHEVGAGSVLVEPDGWSGEWHVHETLRKVYVLSPTAPA